MALPDRPEHQKQDSYSQGIDLVRLISNEFGNSPALIKNQLLQGRVEIDDQPVKVDGNFFIPYAVAKGKEIVIIGPDRHWKIQYDG